jgi:uncharacterized protein involved in exopolysaccharide biosynthesis
MEELHRNGQNGQNGHNGHNGTAHNGVKTPSSIVKDFVAIMFRRRELMKKVFLWTALGTLVAVFFFGVIYESDMEIMVRNDMVEAAVTPDTNARTTSTDMTMAINSEVELLMSQDVLREVVNRCPMLVEGTSLPSRMARKVTGLIPGYQETKFPDAVKKLAAKLEVTAVKDANNITVTYTATDPVKSGCVMASLADVYMTKRNDVNRPPKLFDFFAQQTENYRKRLLLAEQKLLDFASQQDAVMAGTQAQIAVTQSSQFLASLRNVEQQIKQTKEQIAALEGQQAVIPPRFETENKSADNVNLLSNLGTTLNSLENTRTDYLYRYDPNYRLVQDVEKQIAQTQGMLTKQNDERTHEWTTDNNPTYQWVQQQLAQSRTTLPSMQAEAKAMAGTVKTYQDEAQAFNKKSVVQDDLTREVKAEEGNYLLYLAKREQARISDMLDNRRIQNVTFDESPTWPAIPVFSPLLLVVLSFVLAGFLSIGIGLTADYLDPSFRTPDEVKDYLDIPVFASIPANGHDVPVGAAPKNGH